MKGKLRALKRLGCAELDGSQRTYTPADFAKTFGWQNDPEKAELLGK